MKTKSISREEVIFEVLQATGLNWTVNKVQSHYQHNGVWMPQEGKFANVRSDNGQDVGAVGKNYTVLQNAQMVEMVYDAGAEVFDVNGEIKHPWNNVKEDGSLGTFGNMAGGSLKGGSATFCQLALPDDSVGKSGIKRFITFTNHHNGFKPLGFGTANQVICCANTFAIAEAEISKIRHNATMRERVEEAKQALRRMLEFEEIQMSIFNKAAKKKLTNKHKFALYDAIFGEDFKRYEAKDKELHQRTINRIEAFAADIEISVQEQGSTLWALFNSATRFTNHTMNQTAKDKDYSLLFGTEATINQNAYQLLENWVA